jgi:ABC-type multidrug transport system fused ATPase/permease subunit
LHDESIIGSSDLIKGNIEFRGISFKYPNRNEYLFKDLSFKVEENERVAIVGQSGTGKTTIADLLFKIYRQE